ncbi:MAG TPA: hypothetical protein VMZ52_13400 [Bryobacteraceae bacterium]|nr:hypothetical protein [Bryobacteraceae bacterium]
MRETCDKASDLEAEYILASGTHSMAVQVLMGCDENAAPGDYLTLKRIVDNARVAAEAALDALERHRMEHGC